MNSQSLHPLGWPHSVKVIDSHTGGEPTRVVIEGGPELGDGSLAELRMRFRDQFDDFRAAVVLEPRGSDVLVGGLLVEPHEPGCVAGVIFFNNVDVLNMCGHGTLGLVETLAYLGLIVKGRYLLDTPVGIVGFEYHGKGLVSFDNVPSFRHAKDVVVEVEGHGPVTGDVAWGGNWFFLVEEHGFEISARNISSLVDFTLRIRAALERDKVRGAKGGLIDHVELFGPTENPETDSRNFVLCPGGAYDRSPCGTGTSAKLACLVAEGKLALGEPWRQESVIGSVFEGVARMEGEDLVPTIRGSAHIIGESTLFFDKVDPFRFGIR